MIAFDLDGVFVSDLVHTNEDLDCVLNVRNTSIQPLFRIPYPYYIITGRPKCDETDTRRWIENTFHQKHRPLKIFHENTDIGRPVGYKAKVLRENSDIETFVESELEQVSSLRELVPNCRILHFEELLIPLLKGLD